MIKFLLFFIVLKIVQISPCTPNIVNSPLTPSGTNKYYYLQTSIKTNWYKAYQHCRHLGMHLVSMPTDEDINKVSNFLLQHVSDENTQVWTSGSDLDEEGKYVWLGIGRPFYLNSASWGPGQPDNAGNKEHCISMYRRPGDTMGYRLNDLPCKENMYYICEYVQDVCID